MSNQDTNSPTPAVESPVKSANWFTTTALPAIGAFVAARLFGIVGLVVACVVYLVLKDRIGAIFAAIVALIVAGAAWLGAAMLLVQT